MPAERTSKNRTSGSGWFAQDLPDPGAKLAKGGHVVRIGIREQEGDNFVNRHLGERFAFFGYLVSPIRLQATNNDFRAIEAPHLGNVQSRVNRQAVNQASRNLNPQS